MDTIPTACCSRRTQSMPAALCPFSIFTKHGRSSSGIMGWKPVFLRGFYTMLETSWIIRFCCAGKICIRGWWGARCLPGQTRRGLASQPSGTEAEKNGYRSEMSPGGGPACARCQEASWGTDTFHLGLKKTTLTWKASFIPGFVQRWVYTAHVANHNIITITL